MKFRHRLAGLCLSFVFLCSINSALADVELASIFGDSMVLQHELPVPVWGWAEPGEKVKVSLGDQSKSVVADKSGRWLVKLDAIDANAEGQSLTVAGNN